MELILIYAQLGGTVKVVRYFGFVSSMFRILTLTGIVSECRHITLAGGILFTLNLFTYLVIHTADVSSKRGLFIKLTVAALRFPKTYKIVYIDPQVEPTYKT